MFFSSEISICFHISLRKISAHWPFPIENEIRRDPLSLSPYPKAASAASGWFQNLPLEKIQVGKQKHREMQGLHSGSLWSSCPDVLTKTFWISVWQWEANLKEGLLCCCLPAKTHWHITTWPACPVCRASETTWNRTTLTFVLCKYSLWTSWST